MDQQQQSRWQPTRQQLLWAGAVVGLLTIAVLIGYRYDITLWDWIKLLVVPAVIAGGGLWFNAQQRGREQRITDVRAQEDALQDYVDKMSELLTNTERPLSTATLGDTLSRVAQAKTQSVLSRLDGPRKGSVLRFLYGAELIHKRQILSLERPGQSEQEEHLHRVFEEFVEGRRKERVRYLELRGPIVSLGGADLSKTDLRQSGYLYLWRAALDKAILRESDLSGAILREATLTEADLSGSNLSGASLHEADLRKADLSDTNLSGASLHEANLEYADLRGAKGCTVKQLRTAGSLGNATLPNGAKFADWLKEAAKEHVARVNDKERRGEHLSLEEESSLSLFAGWLKEYADRLNDKERRGEYLTYEEKSLLNEYKDNISSGWLKEHVDRLKDRRRRGGPLTAEEGSILDKYKGEDKECRKEDADKE